MGKIQRKSPHFLKNLQKYIILESKIINKFKIYSKSKSKNHHFFSDGSDYKATLSDVIYRCRLNEENFADFTIEIIPGPEFRVEKFQKSIYVVEQEDLKVECDIVKQNNSEIGNNMKAILV